VSASKAPRPQSIGDLRTFRLLPWALGRPLRAQMKNKQTDIASFFGGKPKAPPAPRATADDAKPPEPAAAEAPAVEGGQRLKRLRKAGNASDVSNAAAAAPPLDDLEDADVAAPAPAPLPSASPASTGRKRKQGATPASSDLRVTETVAAAERLATAIEEDVEAKAKGGALQMADEEEAASTPEASEGEEEEEEEEEGEEAEAKPSKAAKKPKKRGPAKSPVAKGLKVDGVGALAIKAAAEHSGFDLSALVTWEAGKPVPFSFVADAFEAIASESKVGFTCLFILSFLFLLSATGFLSSASTSP
jgi:hypothetical protein